MHRIVLIESDWLDHIIQFIHHLPVQSDRMGGSAMKPTEILMEEHRVIERVLYALERASERLIRGEDVIYASSLERRYLLETTPITAITERKAVCFPR